MRAISEARPAAVWAFGFLLTACADPAADALDEARTAFDRFQRAALHGDRAALRALTTRESEPAIDGLEPATDRPPLAVESVVPVHPGRCDVVATDPLAEGSTSRWVVVREAGAWRVDLVTTVGIQNPVERSIEVAIEPAPH